jgi:hypothetical protein
MCADQYSGLVAVNQFVQNLISLPFFLCTILFSALTRSDEHLYHIEQNLDNAISVTKSIDWQFRWYGHGECKLLVDGQWLYDAFNFSQQSMEVKSSQIQREATTFKPREVKDIVYQ